MTSHLDQVHTFIQSNFHCPGTDSIDAMIGLSKFAKQVLTSESIPSSVKNRNTTQNNKWIKFALLRQDEGGLGLESVPDQLGQVSTA